MFAVGSVVVSIDAELGWGFHDLSTPPPDRLEAGRRGWRSLATLLEEYEIPATWAVVGHLMLTDCDGIHEDHPRGPEWFHRERAEWAERPDLRFSPGLISDLLESPVGHEIASHSFSHVLFGDPETSRETAAYELERSLEIATEWGLSLESFVYPRNDVGHREVLADAGIRTYRGRSPTRDGIRGMLGSSIGGDSLLVTPTVDEYGLVDVPASTFLFGFEGPARRMVESVWRDPMVVQVHRGIEAAAASDGVFHLWLHPNNLVTGRDDRRVEAILERIQARRTEGRLRVETMGDVGSRVLEGTSTPRLATDRCH